MYEEREIVFPYDLKGRQAIMFVQNMENNIQRSVFLEKEGRRVNAKSILGVLSLGVKQGEKISCYLDIGVSFDDITHIIKSV